MYIATFIGFCALTCLIILRGPQCSGKTEVSQRLRETLDKKHKKRTYLLKLNEINTERFKKGLARLSCSGNINSAQTKTIPTMISMTSILDFHSRTRICL